MSDYSSWPLLFVAHAIKEKPDATPRYANGVVEYAEAAIESHQRHTREGNTVLVRLIEEQIAFMKTQVGDVEYDRARALIAKSKGLE